jgi:hypothetical protein
VRRVHGARRRTGAALVRAAVSRRRRQGRCTTIEGLTARPGEALKRAWTELEVPQCGYCQCGQIMSAAVLLAEKPQPSDADIDACMAGNVCRCATYVRIRARDPPRGRARRGGRDERPLLRRRDFLRVSRRAGGGSWLAFRWPGGARRRRAGAPARPTGAQRLRAHRARRRVTVIVNKAEMGQGVCTSLCHAPGRGARRGLDARGLRVRARSTRSTRTRATASR